MSAEVEGGEWGDLFFPNPMNSKPLPFLKKFWPPKQDFFLYYHDKVRIFIPTSSKRENRERTE